MPLGRLRDGRHCEEAVMSRACVSKCVDVSVRYKRARVFFRARSHPNASKFVQMHPNSTDRIQVLSLIHI
eukprot:4366345-Pyramimonas_sp.AAC.2